MGSLYITPLSGRSATTSDIRPYPIRVKSALNRLKKQGFSRFELLETAHHSVIYGYHIDGGPELFARYGADWVACAGTFIVGGESGHRVLRDVLKKFDGSRSSLGNVVGQYAIALYKNGVINLLVDNVGAYQLFHDAKLDTFSTSFTALALEQEILHFDHQGVHEYVFVGAPVGDDTVFKQIRRLGPELRAELSVDSILKPFPSGRSSVPVLVDPSDESIKLLRDKAIEKLTEITSQAISVWGERIQCPLSGGLDSRLILALFRQHGVRPHVYVYGDENSADVQVARELAIRVGFPIEVFDKSAWQGSERDEYVETVSRNFDECDGLPVDGSLFDTGANSFARAQRQKDGALAVSGGCGEVFRNFFFLPDRSMSARDVVQAFYCRYDQRQLAPNFDAKAYESALVEKALNALGVDDEMLNRNEVEMLYPRLRCRSFFGREISIVASRGGYLMPFLEQDVVDVALNLPLRLKSAGQFESQMLAALDPELAALPSAYGHSFLDEPSFSHKLSERLTEFRPIAFRKKSYMIKRRLGMQSSSLNAVPNMDWIGLAVDPSCPIMSRFFRIESLDDASVYQQVLALEYLSVFLGSRIKI